MKTLWQLGKGHVLQSDQTSGDFKGTLGVDREAPVGFTDIRLRFELDTDATEEQIADLLTTTERYCVVLQTLRTSPVVEASIARA